VLSSIQENFGGWAPILTEIQSAQPISLIYYGGKQQQQQHIKTGNDCSSPIITGNNGEWKPIWSSTEFSAHSSSLNSGHHAFFFIIDHPILPP